MQGFPHDQISEFSAIIGSTTVERSVRSLLSELQVASRCERLRVSGPVVQDPFAETALLQQELPQISSYWLWPTISGFYQPFDP